MCLWDLKSRGLASARVGRQYVVAQRFRCAKSPLDPRRLTILLGNLAAFYAEQYRPMDAASLLAEAVEEAITLVPKKVVMVRSPTSNLIVTYWERGPAHEASRISATS